MNESELSQFAQGKFQGEVIQKLDDISKKLDAVNTAQGAMDSRMRILENWRYWVIGAATIAGGASSIVVKVLSK